MSLICYYFYLLDYTQDFCGIMSKKELIKHLIENYNFKKEGTKPQYKDQSCIIENTYSVGYNFISKKIQWSNNRSKML